MSADDVVKDAKVFLCASAGDDLVDRFAAHLDLLLVTEDYAVLACEHDMQSNQDGEYLTALCMFSSSHTSIYFLLTFILSLLDRHENILDVVTW
jgi:hypothetical protein